MIVVRNCFVAKPGNASKLAALLKDSMSVANFGGLRDVRVLTDLTGDFNRVIMEYVADNIGQFEADMKDYYSNQALRDKMKGYTDLYVTGSREILQVA